jgi:hypothetical protein
MPERFDDLLEQVRALGPEVPGFQDLCDRLCRAHSDATGEAFVTGSVTALDHLVFGVRYDGSDVDEVEWYDARKLGRVPWGFHRRSRRDVFGWMAERAEPTLGCVTERLEVEAAES